MPDEDQRAEGETEGDPASQGDPRYREPDPEADLPHVEPDPEADLRDPAEERPTIPSVDVPDPAPEDVPSALLQGFWVTVLVVNAALLSLSVGLLMLVFGVKRPVGAGLALLGLLLARRGYRLYRRLDERHRGGELTATDDGPDPERNG